MIKKRLSIQGLSLLEVVVALAVLLVGIMGVSVAVIQSLRLHGSNREQMLVMNFAKQTLAQLEMYNATYGLEKTYQYYRKNDVGSNRYWNVAVDETDASGSTVPHLLDADPETNLANLKMPRIGVVCWVDFPESLDTITGLPQLIETVPADNNPYQCALTYLPDYTQYQNFELDSNWANDFDPVDLNGNGTTNDMIVLGDFPAIPAPELSRLPVRITIRWKSSYGGILEHKLNSVLPKLN